MQALSMAYETDFNPVDYLSRRIIYYKKKRGTVRNLINNEILVTRYGKRKLKILIHDNVKHIDSRIKEYSDAILKLKGYTL